MTERPSTPPPRTAPSNPGVLPRSPLTPEQVKNIVCLALSSQLVLTFLLTDQVGNQPPKSQSSPLPTRIRSPQQQRCPHNLPQTLFQHSHLQQPRRGSKTPLLLHHSRRHVHPKRCPEHYTRGGSREARRLSPPGRNPAGEKLYKVRRV